MVKGWGLGFGVESVGCRVIVSRLGVGAPGASRAPAYLGGSVQGRKVDIKLPGKGNSDNHGARPVHKIISMIKWIRTSRLSIENLISLWGSGFMVWGLGCRVGVWGLKLRVQVVWCTVKRVRLRV
jgi:hypothetical protein